MKISDEDQQSTDFDWFATDELGNVAHFATAGYKMLPTSVAESREDLDKVTSYFASLPDRTTLNVDGGIAKQLPEWKGAASETKYLQSFAAMAKLGLFSFDIASHLNEDAAYFRVAIPGVPLRLIELPPDIRDIISRTKLQSTNLADCSRIPYSMTLTI